jgi:hypothetical protein
MKVGFLLIPLIAVAAGASAQTLIISSPSSEGSAGSEIVITLGAGEKKAPVALQFDVIISGKPIAPAQWTYSVSEAAKTAGKTAQCGGRWKKAPVEYVYTCIISGGTSEFAAGPVFSANLVRPAEPKWKGGKVTLENAQAVDAEGRHYPFKKSEWVYR